MRDYINSVFGPNGVLSHLLPRYEPRQGQIRLAEAVDDALTGHHLLAEAPTGTGKSLAYAVPASWHTAERKLKRIVIATANIALQEQLVKKDLPFLQRVLPWQFRFALVKGRSNYLCLDRLDHAATAQAKMQFADSLAFDRLTKWAHTTLTGDMSELQEVPHFKLWGELSVGADQCKGSKCPRRHECHTQRAKNAAESAQLIVANYHLLFADVVVRDATSDSMGVMPTYDAVICDEGHRIGDIARDFFGTKTSEAACRRLVSDGMRAVKDSGIDGMPGTLDRAMIALEDEAKLFFGSALDYRRSSEYDKRLQSVGEIDPSALVSCLNRLAAQFTMVSDDDRLDGSDRYIFRKLSDRSAKHATGLSEAAAIADPDGKVYFVEESQGGAKTGARAAVSSKPIDVSENLREGLFDKYKCVIAMSATMTTAPNDFEHVAADLGVYDAAEIVVASPFDLPNQVLFVVPADIPEPNRPEFRDAMPEAIVRTVELASGRTLGLFTSYKNLGIAAAALRRSQVSTKYRILVQGEGPRTALVEAFRKDVSSVLLGTESFWEGIDVPGEALSCLIIDRLPFVTPDDPIVDAIAKRDPRGWFMKWSLPRALIAFRQGFGRLIRTTTDRGVVVCLDRRIHDKPYGRTFVRALGGVRVSRSLEDVGLFLQG